MASHHTQRGPTRSSREKKPGPPALNDAIASDSKRLIGLAERWMGAKSPLVTSRISGLPSKNRFEMARELMAAFCAVVVRNSSNSAASVRERCVAATAFESFTALCEGAGGPGWAAMVAAMLIVQTPRANANAIRLLMTLIVASLSRAQCAGAVPSSFLRGNHTPHV